jgi:PilZ domain
MVWQINYMSAKNNEKIILIIDSNGPEKLVLSSILGRLGYKVVTGSTISDIEKHLPDCPNLVILNSAIKGADDKAFSIGTPQCRVILLAPPVENAPDFIGFIDATEHVLRGIGVTIPELVMVVNDFISPAPGKGIKRQPRVAGGYRVDVLKDGERQKAFIFNLSATGAFIELSNPPERTTVITLEFELPGIDQMFSFKSKVTWSVLPEESTAMRSPPGCGVYFMDISQEHHEILEKFVIHKGRS